MSDHADIAHNPTAALDGGLPVLLTFLAHRPAASEPQCSADTSMSAGLALIGGGPFRFTLSISDLLL